MTHILITGASSGIGWSLAKAYDQPGHHLTLVARREVELKNLQKEIKTTSSIVVADLSQPSQHWLTDVIQKNGPIDILINNAGLCFVEPTIGVSGNRWQKLLQVNLSTPIHLIHEVLPGMVSRKKGTIINISSVAAITPLSFYSHYNASKAGLAAYSESLHEEVKGEGVHVLTVYPGPVSTPMETLIIGQLKKTFFRDKAPRGTSQGLASSILKYVAKNKKRLIYPRLYTVSWYVPWLGQWIANRTSPPAMGNTTPTT